MIVDASVLIDAVADPGRRGLAARSVLAAQQGDDPLIAPAHLPLDVVCALHAAANRPDHPLRPADLAQALSAAESFEILIEATPWVDVQRASALAAGLLTHAEALYVAAAERHGIALLTADSRMARVARSDLLVRCPIVTIDAGGTTLR